MAASVGGLFIIGFCFKLILDTDDILGDSNVTVAEKTERTTDLTPTNISPVSDIKRSDEGLDEISKRLAVICFSVGASAVVFGLSGICTAKIRRCPCTCTFGFLSLIFTILYALSAVVLLSIYYVSNE